jgi:hypothetical protein
MIGPVPRQQFINPVDLVIVYAVENVGKVSLWIDGVQLGGFDDRHRTCQGFRPGVSTRKEPVFAPNPDRAHGTFCRVVIDSHATILKDQTERRPTAQTIAKGFCQIALAWDARQLVFGPEFEGINLWLARLLTCCKARICWLTCDFALDLVELPYPVEGLTSDL